MIHYSNMICIAGKTILIQSVIEGVIGFFDNMASILSFYILRRFESARHLINVKAQAKDQATKMFANLFKSAILKKSKDAFDEEQNITPSCREAAIKHKIVITGAGFTRLS